MLEADHRLVEDLIARIKEADPSERQALVDELTTNVVAHMELEEAVVYPAMQPVTGAEAVEEGNKEHELARTALEQVRELAPDEPGFMAAVDTFEAAISHHVEDEEEEVFPELRRDGADALAAMATPFMQQRVELGMPMDPAALSAASTKDELVAEAEHAGVEGARSMTKEELAEALVGAMG